MDSSPHSQRGTFPPNTFETWDFLSVPSSWRQISSGAIYSATPAWTGCFLGLQYGQHPKNAALSCAILNRVSFLLWSTFFSTFLRNGSWSSSFLRYCMSKMSLFYLHSWLVFQLDDELKIRIYFPSESVLPPPQPYHLVLLSESLMSPWSLIFCFWPFFFSYLEVSTTSLHPVF